MGSGDTILNDERSWVWCVRNSPDGVSSPLPSRLPEPIDSLIIENDGKTMSPVRREWMHLARDELIGSSLTHE